MLFKKIFISATFILPLLINASEVDSWSLRDQVLSFSSLDSVEILNRYTEGQLEIARQEANHLSNGVCSEKILRTSMYHHLASRHGVGTGNIENYIRTSESMQNLRARLPLKESVYRDFRWSDSFSAYMAEKDAIGHVINYRNLVVGSDKFGHFFAQGYNYYRKAKRDEKPSFVEAMEYGSYSEKTYFGLVSSGVFSYGDLSANYEGFRFWSMLTPQSTKPHKAYFICQNGVWEKNRDFTWDDFVSPAWDEAINTSYFRTKVMYDNFRAHVADTGVTFPLSKEDCAKVIQRYYKNKKLLHYLVSPRCAALAPELLTPTEQNNFREIHQSLSDESKNQITLQNFLWGLFESVWQEMF